MTTTSAVAFGTTTTAHGDVTPSPDKPTRDARAGHPHHA